MKRTVGMLCCAILAQLFGTFTGLPVGIAPAFAELGSHFIVEDVVISDPDNSLIDPEFDSQGFHMSWTDREGNLWVNDVDPVFGTWDPPSGTQTLVDVELEGVGPTRQGPEWAYSADGSRILYTKLINDIRYLYQARFENNEWHTSRLSRSRHRAIARGSKDVDDAHPRAIYSYQVEGQPTRIGWRELDDPTTDDAILKNTHLHMWVEGRRAVVMLRDIGGFRQVIEYDTDSQELKQLTFDATHKRFPLMWRDPSLDDEYILVAVVDDTMIGVFRQSGDEWVLTKIFRPPTIYTYAFKLEYFIHDGKSYLSYLMNTHRNGREQAREGNGDIWITEIEHDGVLPFHRRVNDPTITRVKDPENLVTSSGVYIYYAEILEDMSRLIHRCDSGL